MKKVGGWLIRLIPSTIRKLIAVSELEDLMKKNDSDLSCLSMSMIGIIKNIKK